MKIVIVPDPRTNQWHVGHNNVDGFWRHLSSHPSKSEAERELDHQTQVREQRRLENPDTFKGPYELLVENAAEHKALRVALNNLRRFRKGKFGKLDGLAEACTRLLNKRRAKGGGVDVSIC